MNATTMRRVLWVGWVSCGFMVACGDDMDPGEEDAGAMENPDTGTMMMADGQRPMPDAGTDAGGDGRDAEVNEDAGGDTGVPVDSGTPDAGPVECDPETMPFGGGAGTEASPYLICSTNQLDNVRDDASSSFLLEADLDLAGIEWSPIAELSGELDGGGHALFNLTVDDAGAERFALVETLSGSIHDLSLIDVNVAGSRALSTLAVETAEDSGARIERVLVTGEITTQHGSAGGVVLALRGGTSASDVAFAGDINNISATRSEGFVGGIARAVAADATLTRAATWGQITSAGAVKHGGIASDVAGSVTVCASHMDIQSSGPQVGGIAAVLVAPTGVIEDCYADGELDGSAVVGGLVAEQWAPMAGNGTLRRAAFWGSSSGDSIIAAGMPTLDDVFWDTDRSGTSALAGAMGVTTAQLRNPADASLSALTTPPWKREQDRDPRLEFEDAVFPDELPCNVAGTPFGAGTGTPYRPYVICSAGHLEALRSDSTAIYVLARDLDLMGVNLAPLPGLEGRFDGRGHAIANWSYSDTDSTTGRRIALFENVSGRLANLRLTNVVLHGYQGVAGLAFETEAGARAHISNVEVHGSLTAENGSIGGVIVALRNEARLENARFSGTITSLGVMGGDFLGGVAQVIAHGSEARGLVSEGTISAGDSDKAGGIASSVTGTLSECASHMDVSANNLKVGGVAAVLGGADAVIRNCYADGDLEGNIAGGIIAEQWQGAVPLPIGTGSITRAYFAGTLMATNADPVAPVGNPDVEAIVFDSDTAGMTSRVMATGLTTAQLQDPDSSAFDTWPSPPWEFQSGAYPVLAHE